MSKTNIGEINFTTSNKIFRNKTDIAIDLFVKFLRYLATKDKVNIEIEKETYSLTIHADAYEFCVEDNIPLSVIVSKVFDIKRMKILTKEVYDSLKTYLIAESEYIENKQKEESDIDEKWEFVDIGSM